LDGELFELAWLPDDDPRKDLRRRGRLALVLDSKLSVQPPKKERRRSEGRHFFVESSSSKRNGAGPSRVEADDGEPTVERVLLDDGEAVLAMDCDSVSSLSYCTTAAQVRSVKDARKDNLRAGVRELKLLVPLATLLLLQLGDGNVKTSSLVIDDRR
jgi:hypothetical protein